MSLRKTNIQRSVRFMTLTEIIIYMGLAGVLSAMVFSFTMMARSGVTQQQHQMKYTSIGKFGGERLVTLVRKGRTVSVVNGDEIRIMHPEKKIKQLQFIDEDGDPNTIDDNVIVCDPDYPSTKSYEVVSCVNPINVTTADEKPIFKKIGNNGVRMCFHVGDPPNVEKAKYKSGSGYQGIQIRVTAKPRDVGHTWSRGIAKD